MFMSNEQAQQKKSRSSYYHMAIIVIFFAAAVGLKALQYYWPKATLQFGNTTIRVLVAKTPAHQHRGLGNRDTLEPYDGMLFVFPEARRVGIVMRDMRFPIDIVWLSGGSVVDIAPRAPLEPGVAEENLHVYFPRQDADLVLELPAGWTEEHGIRIGDRLQVIDE